MIAPVRLQLSRKKGFNLQALSLSTNGLPAVSVARPGEWGNPYTLIVGRGAPEAVELFERDMASPHTSKIYLREKLAGRNLACWCKPGAPCHADVLLRLANEPRCERVE